MLWMEGDQAAISWVSDRMPSMNGTPRITSRSKALPFRRRQWLWAHWANLNTIVKHAIRLPLPFVRSVRRRTVENIDSIGFDVRR